VRLAYIPIMLVLGAGLLWAYRWLIGVGSDPVGTLLL